MELYFLNRRLYGRSRRLLRQPRIHIFPTIEVVLCRFTVNISETCNYTTPQRKGSMGLYFMTITYSRCNLLTPVINGVARVLGLGDEKLDLLGGSRGIPPRKCLDF